MKENKLLSLQKHLQLVQNQAGNPSKKYIGGKLLAYKEWVSREIQRTKKAIGELRENS